MKNNQFPWIALLLIPLYSISFEINSGSSSVHYDGAAIAIAILGISVIVMAFSITNRFQDFLISKKIILNRVKSKYERLIAFVIIAPMIGYSNYGERIEGINGEQVYSWMFKTGQSELYLWAIPLFIFITFLHRISLIIQEATKTSANQSE